jgi:tripartite-type tricarboxylate transporter receptor subunit TctC
MIGDELGKSLGWRIVIDNRAGGGTIIGTETVAHAPPDGYTLFYGTMAGLDIVHVPYKGAGPAMIDLLGGNVNFMITALLGTARARKSNDEGLVAGRR